jgi:hypothetical protein
MYNNALIQYLLYKGLTTRVLRSYAANGYRCSSYQISLEWPYKSQMQKHIFLDGRCTFIFLNIVFYSRNWCCGAALFFCCHASGSWKKIWLTSVFFHWKFPQQVSSNETGWTDCREYLNCQCCGARTASKKFLPEPNKNIALPQHKKKTS